MGERGSLCKTKQVNAQGGAGEAGEAGTSLCKQDDRVNSQGGEAGRVCEMKCVRLRHGERPQPDVQLHYRNETQPGVEFLNTES
jgi:hypothetical protein